MQMQELAPALQDAGLNGAVFGLLLVIMELIRGKREAGRDDSIAAAIDKFATMMEKQDERIAAAFERVGRVLEEMQKELDEVRNDAKWLKAVHDDKFEGGYSWHNHAVIRRMEEMRDKGDKQIELMQKKLEQGGRILTVLRVIDSRLARGSGLGANGENGE